MGEQKNRMGWDEIRGRGWEGMGEGEGRGEEGRRDGRWEWGIDQRKERAEEEG